MINNQVNNLPVNSNSNVESQTAETVEAIVSQLMEKQRLARNGAVNGVVPSAPLGVASAASMLNNANGNSSSNGNNMNHQQQPVISSLQSSSISVADSLI